MCIGITIPFFAYNQTVEYDKMQISTCLIVLYSTVIGLVWRLSKSAFLCGGFGRRTFWFHERLCSEIYKHSAQNAETQASICYHTTPKDTPSGDLQ